MSNQWLLIRKSEAYYWPPLQLYCSFQVNKMCECDAVKLRLVNLLSSYSAAKYWACGGVSSSLLVLESALVVNATINILCITVCVVMYSMLTVFMKRFWTILWICGTIIKFYSTLKERVYSRLEGSATSIISTLAYSWFTNICIYRLGRCCLDSDYNYGTEINEQNNLQINSYSPNGLCSDVKARTVRSIRLDAEIDLHKNMGT